MKRKKTILLMAAEVITIAIIVFLLYVDHKEVELEFVGYASTDGAVEHGEPVAYTWGSCSNELARCLIGRDSSSDVLLGLGMQYELSVSELDGKGFYYICGGCELSKIEYFYHSKWFSERGEFVVMNMPKIKPIAKRTKLISVYRGDVLVYE